MSATENSVAAGVYSEIGSLKKVLLHRPGDEMKILTQDVKKDFLFGDIPSLTDLQQQHDNFARILEREGCRVYYYRDLLVDVLTDPGVREIAINLLCTDISASDNLERLRGKLRDMPPNLLCDKLICGIKSPSHEDGYHAYPLPNLYFTRDVGLIVGKGMILAHMSTMARRREPGLLKLLHSYHPLFSQIRKNLWYDGLEKEGNLEGGDILILSPEALAIGASIRSSRKDMDAFAKGLFGRDSGFRRILVVEMPHEEEFFHLDTVLTMVDRGKFAYYPVVHDDLKFFIMESAGRDNLKIQEMHSLEKALERILGFSGIELITCLPQQGNEMTRTQSSTGANSLAIAPGKVLLYNGSDVNTENLGKSGVEIIGVEGSQLMCGRGGPHCMSMPIEREN